MNPNWIRKTKINIVSKGFNISFTIFCFILLEKTINPLEWTWIPIFSNSESLPAFLSMGCVYISYFHSVTQANTTPQNANERGYRYIEKQFGFFNVLFWPSFRAQITLCIHGMVMHQKSKKVYSSFFFIWEIFTINTMNIQQNKKYPWTYEQFSNAKHGRTYKNVFCKSYTSV